MPKLLSVRHLALRTRHLLLKRQASDPAKAVFTASRLINALSLLLPVVWILSLLWTDAARLIDIGFNLRGKWLRGAVDWSLFILPPIIITIACIAILQPVLARIRCRSFCGDRKMGEGSQAHGMPQEHARLSIRVGHFPA
jgi:hypothetical protein